ncbi:MAG: hypothetical protein LBT27_01705 [Prevotellaceae bacterium]|jgi:hypothetical protein|nr:hypothetical protein [Prevotellaceae bacterium]
MAYGDDNCHSNEVKLLLKLGKCAEAKEICKTALDDANSKCNEEMTILLKVCNSCASLQEKIKSAKNDAERYNLTEQLYKENPFYNQAQYEAVKILKQQYEKQTEEQNVLQKKLSDKVDTATKKSQKDSARADSAEKVAQRAREKSYEDSVKAKSAEEKAITNSLIAKQAIADKDEAVADKNKAEQQLEKIKAVLYYDNKIALASMQDTNKQTFYFFIDENGDEITKLKRWDKAEPFGVNYVGYAKVTRKGKEYLINTLGKEESYSRGYNTASDFSGYDYSCQAAGLEASPQNCIENVLDDKFKNKEIKILDLHNTKLPKFNPEKFDFPKLEYLDLSNNNLKYNDAFQGIEYVPTLKYLILNNSKITNLPTSFKKLKNLIYLDVSGNKIKNLSEFISEFIENGIKNLTLRVDESQKKALEEPIMAEKIKTSGWKIII